MTSKRTLRTIGTTVKYDNMDYSDAAREANAEVDKERK